MKPFGQWLNDQAAEEEVELVIPYCCVCEDEIDIESLDMYPEDVTEDDEFYCGKDPHCCP
jgi:hypothetical protein